MNTNIVTFSGTNVELKSEVFIKGTLQAAKYDEAYKIILNYIILNYNNMVYKAFEYKDRIKESNTLNKPSVPMITKVVQVAIVGKEIALFGKEF